MGQTKGSARLYLGLENLRIPPARSSSRSAMRTNSATCRRQCAYRARFVGSGASRLDVERLDADPAEPVAHVCRDEGQAVEHVVGSKPSGNDDRQAPARELFSADSGAQLDGRAAAVGAATRAAIRRLARGTGGHGHVRRPALRARLRRRPCVPAIARRVRARLLFEKPAMRNLVFLVILAALTLGNGIYHLATYKMLAVDPLAAIRAARPK
jgi:hypothetical protein